MNNAGYNFIAMGALLTGMRDLSPVEFKVMAAIVNRMGQDGTCWPSRQTMADDCGMSVNALDKTLRSLKSKKWLDSEPRYKSDGGQTSSRWFIPKEALTSSMDPPSGQTRDLPSGQMPPPPYMGNEVYTVEVDTKNTKGLPFEDFWKVYPNKTGKKPASQKWSKLTKKDQESIIADLPKRSKTEAWVKDRGRYVPMATTYLNQERWNDPIDSVEATASDLREWM